MKGERGKGKEERGKRKGERGKGKGERGKGKGERERGKEKRGKCKTGKKYFFVSFIATRSLSLCKKVTNHYPVFFCTKI